MKGHGRRDVAQPVPVGARFTRTLNGVPNYPFGFAFCVLFWKLAFVFATCDRVATAQSALREFKGRCVDWGV